MVAVHALLTVMAVITVAVGVVLNQTNTKPFTQIEVEAPEVLSEQTQVIATISPKPTSTPSLSPVKTPTSTPSIQGVSVDTNFVYPGSQILERTNNTLTMLSTDDPTKIITWYQTHIKQLKLNARSTAQTNTNGNVLAKIAAASADLDVEIEIKKASADSQARIIVEITQ